MTRVELNMKRRLHEGFPGTRDRYPTGEKEYRSDEVNSMQLNLLRKALAKCGLEKVDRGDRLNNAYRKKSDDVIEMFVWPREYKVMDEYVHANVSITETGKVSVSITAYSTFPKGLTKMFRECGFDVAVSNIIADDEKDKDRYNDWGSSYNKMDIDNAPLDQIEMPSVSLEDATKMFGKLAQHLPKAQAQYMKDTRDADGHFKTEKEYNKEKGLSSSGEYCLVIDWADGCDPIEIESFVDGKSGQDKFGTLESVVKQILTDIGAEDDFVDMFNTQYGDEHTFNFNGAVSSWLNDFINKDSYETMSVSQETVNTLKGILDNLRDENIIGQDPVKVTIDEVNMNPARAKKVKKVPQRALHFENRQYRGKAKEALREAVDAECKKAIKRLQKTLTDLIDENWGDEDVEDRGEVEIANRCVINSVLRGTLDGFEDYMGCEDYIEEDEVPGLEDCVEDVVDEVTSEISDILEDYMAEDEDYEDEDSVTDIDDEHELVSDDVVGANDELCRDICKAVYKAVEPYCPPDDFFVDHGEPLFN